MQSIRTVRLVPLVLAAALLSSAVLATMHFRLERSSPEAGAVVTAPTEIRLWFSQEPQTDSTSIRIVDASGDLAADGEVEADPEDPKIQVLPLPDALPPGEYQVAWRAMAADGHVVRDGFVFTVAQ